MSVEYNYEPVDERWTKEILRKTGVKPMLVLRMAQHNGINIYQLECILQYIIEDEFK